MPSADSISKLAMQDTGATAIGEDPSPNELANCFTRLQNLIGRLATQRLVCPFTQQYVFPLVSNQATYELGIGAADWVTPFSPKVIPQAAWRSLNNPNQPVDLPVDVITVKDYRDITIKALTAAIVSRIWYQPPSTSAFGTVYVWPVYSGPSSSLVLYLPTSLAPFQDQTTSVYLPDGYSEALQKLLAVELIGVGGVPPTLWNWLVGRAKEGLGWLKSQNLGVTVNDLQCDNQLVNMGQPHTWNPYTGTDTTR